MSSDKKALPSERIKDIADGYVANYPEAIMIFLDEQAELLDTHTPETSNLGFIRQYLGEVPPDRTFTAKELWEVFNAFAPLLTKEQEKEIVDAIKGIDTHTVKEEKCCNEENCMAKDDLIPHEHVKEESTTPEKTCPNKGKENCICSQCYMPTTPEKKCCFNCGIGSDGCKNNSMSSKEVPE